VRHNLHCIIFQPVYGIVDGKPKALLERGQWVALAGSSATISFSRLEDAQRIASDPLNEIAAENYFMDHNMQLLIPNSCLAGDSINPDFYQDIQARWIIQDPSILTDQGIHEKFEVNMMPVNNDLEKRQRTQKVSLKNLGQDLSLSQPDLLTMLLKDDTSFTYQNGKWTSY
jgi:hypothetical protein